jgi:hypothetical protein
MLPANATLTEAASGLVFPATDLASILGGGPVIITEIPGTEYTLNGSEAGTVLNFTSMDAITVSVPSDLTVGFIVGTSISFVQGGSGAILFQGADDTVVINSFNDLNQTGGQFATAGLMKTAANTWLLAGNLTA